MIEHFDQPKPIRCVQDLIRARASLRVTCRNCNRVAYVKARFLAMRFGVGMTLERIAPRFSCSHCHRHDVRLALGLDELAEKPSTNFEAFNVYWKHYD